MQINLGGWAWLVKWGAYNNPYPVFGCLRMTLNVTAVFDERELNFTSEI